MESRSNGRFGTSVSRRTLLTGASAAAAGAALGPVVASDRSAVAQAGAIGAGWTHVVGGGSSILFYNKNTGEAMTGTLDGLGFTQVEYYSGIIRFAKGYKVMVGTPSGSMLFVRPSGNGVAGTLVNGVWTLRNEYRGFAPWKIGAATQDSAFLFNDSAGQGASGTLVDGAWTYLGRYRNWQPYTHVVGTVDTLLFYRYGTHNKPAKVGTLENGVFTFTNTYPTDFGDFTPIRWAVAVGTGDSALFLRYREDADGLSGLLVNGGWLDIEYNDGFAPWTHAAHAGNGFVLLYQQADGLAAWGTLSGGVWSYYGTT